MKTIKKFFSRVGSWFARLASPEGQKRLNHVLTEVYGLVEMALPIVETIALVTPTKADDEIVRLVRIYLPHLTAPVLPISDDQKAGLIRAAAVSELEQRVSDKSGIPSSTLNLAIELAYTAFKSTKAA